MKRFFATFLSLLLLAGANANGWLPPEDDIVVEYFDVYVNFDTLHYDSSALSQRDSVFNYLSQQAVNISSDKLGRFAVWRMLPDIVIVPDDVADKRGEVRITVENAPIATLPDTVKDENGDILLPYSVWAKVEVDDALGKAIYSNDFGLLTGSVPLSKAGKDGKITKASSIAGISEVVGRVRDEVYGRYGFDMCKDASVCKVPESSKYYTFLKIVNGDLRRFVDFYTYNDLLCQVYKLNFPFAFLPLDTINSTVTSVEGTILKNGAIDGGYAIEYDNGKISNFSGYIYSKDSEGKIVKQKLNKLYVKYDKKSGEYSGITTTDGQFTRFVFPGYDNVTEWGVKAKKQVNVCKTENLIGSFIKMKSETMEAAEVSIDLYGKIYVDGYTLSSSAFGLFTTLADSNSVKFPALTSENSTKFHTDVTFDPNLNIISRQWTGSVILEKDRGYSNYTYIKLENCKSIVRASELDSHNRPVKFERVASGLLSNNWGLGKNIKIFDAYADGKSSISVKGTSSEDVYEVSYSGTGDINMFYDENDEPVLYKVGDVEIIIKVSH